MKKINLFVGMLAIAGLGFTSCSDDDNENTNENRIEGTYDLEEVNTADATDFNQDEESNINQMEESDCYNDGKITLNADNSLTYVTTGILVNEENGTAGCIESATFSGTWELMEGSGSDAIIQITYEDENEEDQTRILTKIGNELIWEDDTIFSEYADRNEEGGAVYTQGSTQYVFRR